MSFRVVGDCAAWHAQDEVYIFRVGLRLPDEKNCLTYVYFDDKETRDRDCIHFKSVSPERYKIGGIKTILHRGYQIYYIPCIYFRFMGNAIKAVGNKQKKSYLCEA